MTNPSFPPLACSLPHPPTTLRTAVTISGPPSRAATPVAGGKNRKGQPAGKTGGKTSKTSTPAPGNDILAAAAAAVSEMPAIVSSKDELAAALKLAGAKKPKPAQLDRAWAALVSGEARTSDYTGGGGSGSGSGGGTIGVSDYVRGFFLAISVAVAAALRNPDFGLVLTVTLALATAVTSRVLRSCGWRRSEAGGSGCGGVEGIARGSRAGDRTGERGATSAGCATPGRGYYGSGSLRNGTSHGRGGRRS